MSQACGCPPFQIVARIFRASLWISWGKQQHATKSIPPQVPGVARDWPGNVRELRNMADRFVLGLDLGLVTPDAAAPEQGLAVQMAQYERSLIAAALVRYGGSLKATYEGLGLSRKALYEKMQKHGLDKGDFTE